MKKNIYMIFTPIVAVVFFTSCNKDYVIGGEVNDPTVHVNMTTFEYLQSLEVTKQVATLFERAGMKDIINGDVTIIAPTQYSIDRYLRRRHNVELRSNPNAPELSIADISAEELKEMGMYVIPGKHWRENLTKDGTFLKTLNGRDVLLSYNETNIDPGCAWDGAGDPRWGYQYSRFTQVRPRLIHILYKRGNNWEFDGAQRGNPDSPEIDQFYRMFMADILTKNGVIHILYSGDYNYNEHYYYHSLFFYGLRSDDRF